MQCCHNAPCQDRRPWAQTVAQEAPSQHQEQCCAVRVPEHWHRLPRGCGVSFLEVSRSRLAVGLGTLLWVALLQRGWDWGTQKALPASAMLGSCDVLQVHNVKNQLFKI